MHGIGAGRGRATAERGRQGGCARVLMAAALCLLEPALLARESVAQTNAVQLFSAVAPADSGPATDPSLARSFAQKVLVLSCDTKPSAVLSSTRDGTGGVVVDDFISMNGTDVCALPGLRRCGSAGTCSLSCFIQALGVPGDALAAYTPVPAIDISEKLAVGQQTVTFALLDWGGTLAASDVWLVSNCTVVP